MWSVSGKKEEGGIWVSSERPDTCHLANFWRSRTGSRDAERAGDALELLDGDKAGVGCVSSIQLAFLQEAADVFAAEAVTDTSDALDA